MMNAILIGILGAMTFTSRAVGLVLVPSTEGRLQTIFGRLPACLFAALAVVSLMNDAGSVQSGRSLVAAGAGLAVSPKRSLPLIFIAGIAGFLLSGLFL